MQIDIHLRPCFAHMQDMKSILFLPYTLWTISSSPQHIFLSRPQWMDWWYGWQRHNLLEWFLEPKLPCINHCGLSLPCGCWSTLFHSTLKPTPEYRSNSEIQLTIVITWATGNRNSTTIHVHLSHPNILLLWTKIHVLYIKTAPNCEY